MIFHHSVTRQTVGWMDEASIVKSRQKAWKGKGLGKCQWAVSHTEESIFLSLLSELITCWKSRTWPCRNLTSLTALLKTPSSSTVSMFYIVIWCLLCWERIITKCLKTFVNVTVEAELKWEWEDERCHRTVYCKQSSPGVMITIRRLISLHTKINKLSLLKTGLSVY